MRRSILVLIAVVVLSTACGPDHNQPTLTSTTTVANGTATTTGAITSDTGDTQTDSTTAPTTSIERLDPNDPDYPTTELPATTVTYPSD